MNEAKQLLEMVLVLIVPVSVICWNFPRRCKHCRRWVSPLNRYVTCYTFSDAVTHFDLHYGCGKQYFDDLKKRRELPTTTPDKHKTERLRPIPEFYRFLLDESWPIILFLVGLLTLILTKSFLLGGVIGLLVAIGTRTLATLALRFVFKLDTQFVKSHRRF